MSSLILALKGAAVYALAFGALIGTILGSSRLLFGPSAFAPEGLREVTFAMVAGGGVFLALVLVAGVAAMIHIGN